MNMRKRKAKIALFAACALSMSLTACGPAVQPMVGSSAAASENPAKTGTLVSPNGWSTLEASAKAGTKLQYYKEQSVSSMSQGTLHSSFSVYGSLNPPDRAYLAISEGNTNTYYFQQGQVAYYLDNGRWSSTTTISNLNVYPSYVQLITEASKAGTPLYQQKRAYVFDEYCDVYTSVLPAGMVTPLSSFAATAGSAVNQTGQVAVTWYVGQTDHILRRVDTQSIGGVADIGQMQVRTSTLLFDINSPIAKVSVPTDLVKQLENVKP